MCTHRVHVPEHCANAETCRYRGRRWWCHWGSPSNRRPSFVAHCQTIEKSVRSSGSYRVRQPYTKNIYIETPRYEQYQHELHQGPFTSMHKHAQAFTIIHNHSQACTIMHKHSQSFTSIHNHAQAFTYLVPRGQCVAGVAQA